MSCKRSPAPSASLALKGHSVTTLTPYLSDHTHEASHRYAFKASAPAEDVAARNGLHRLDHQRAAIQRQRVASGGTRGHRMHLPLPKASTPVPG